MRANVRAGDVTVGPYFWAGVDQHDPGLSEAARSRGRARPPAAVRSALGRARTTARGHICAFSRTGAVKVPAGARTVPIGVPWTAFRMAADRAIHKKVRDEGVPPDP